MMEFVMTWGTAIGIFVITGTLMQSLNLTIGGKAGDKGLKGLWYVWKRSFALPFGAALGALASVVGMSSPFGDGIGYGVLDGVMAAWLAGRAYKWIVEQAEARAKHKLARQSQPPPKPE